VTSSDLMALLLEDGSPARVLPFDFRVHDGERLAATA
jgi:hypothetical protein